jgi:hypothetical protein
LPRCLSIAAASFALCLGLSALPVSAAAPHLKLSAGTLAVNRTTRLYGTNFQPKKIYYVLLAQPDLKHRKIESLVGGATADRSGRFTVTIKVPVKVKCGKATLYAFRAKSSTLVPLTVKVSGCKAGPVVPPPPPPSKPKGAKP